MVQEPTLPIEPLFLKYVCHAVALGTAVASTYIVPPSGTSLNAPEFTHGLVVKEKSTP